MDGPLGVNKPGYVRSNRIAETDNPSVSKSDQKTDLIKKLLTIFYLTRYKSLYS